MKISIFIVVIMLIAGRCAYKKDEEQYGVIFYFNNSENIFYFIPLDKKENMGNFISDANNAKKGYQFNCYSSVIRDSIKNMVLFKQPLFNYLNEDILSKDTIYFSPVIMNFDYTVSSTYKSEKINISQGKVNLNFNCSYIDVIEIKSLR